MLLLKYNEPYESARTRPLSNKQIRAFKRSLLNIARETCPRDTNNMAENAIYATSSIEGFKIVWDSSFAYYLPFVDKGINPMYPNSAKVKANKGFVARSIAYMHAYTGLFLYGQTSKIEERYGKDVSDFYKTHYSAGSKTAKSKIVRDSPLFVELMYRNLRGESPQQLVKDKGAMIANLIKSLKKEVTSPKRANEISDFIYEYGEERPY